MIILLHEIKNNGKYKYWDYFGRRGWYTKAHWSMVIPISCPWWGGRGRLALQLFSFTASVESNDEEDDKKQWEGRMRMNLFAVQSFLVEEKEIKILYSNNVLPKVTLLIFFSWSYFIWDERLEVCQRLVASIGYSSDVVHVKTTLLTIPLSSASSPLYCHHQHNNHHCWKLYHNHWRSFIFFWPADFWPMWVSTPLLDGRHEIGLNRAKHWVVHLSLVKIG